MLVSTANFGVVVQYGLTPTWRIQLTANSTLRGLTVLDDKRESNAQLPSTSAGSSRPRAILNPIQRVHYADDGLVMAEVGNTCVAIWRTKPVKFLFDRQVSVLCDVIRNHSKPIGFICIVEAKTPAPSDDIRKASVEMLTSRKENLACVVGVIADKGFTSAITRSVLAGMAFLLSRDDFRVNFTESVERAANWMSTYVEIGAISSYCSTIESYRSLLVGRGGAEQCALTDHDSRA